MQSSQDSSRMLQSSISWQVESCGKCVNHLHSGSCWQLSRHCSAVETWTAMWEMLPRHWPVTQQIGSVALKKVFLHFLATFNFLWVNWHQTNKNNLKSRFAAVFEPRTTWSWRDQANDSSTTWLLAFPLAADAVRAESVIQGITASLKPSVIKVSFNLWYFKRLSV